MSLFTLPIPLDETPTIEEEAANGPVAPLEEPINPLLALAMRQQKEREAKAAAMREQLGRTLSQQRGQASGLRSLSMLASFGSNPLLRGLQQEAGQQSGAMDSLSARTEAQLGRGAVQEDGINPLDLIRLQQAQQRLDLLGRREEGLDRRFDASQTMRAQQFAATMGFRWADLNQDQRLAMLRLADAQDARATAAASKKEDQIAGATERLSKEVVDTGAPGFYTRLDEAQALLKKSPKDVPGFGRIEGRLPDEMISEEGRQLRFLVGQLLSEYRKGQTGAGMSDSERVEYGRITGLVNSGSDKGVREGLELLKRAMDARVAATGAGFRPEAVDTLSRRSPRLGQALKSGTQGPSAPRTPATQVMPADGSGNLTLEGPSAAPADIVRVRINGGPPRPVKRSNLEALRQRAAERNDTLEVVDG